MNKHMLKRRSSQRMANLKTTRGIIHYLETHYVYNVQKEEVKGGQTATINI